MGQYITGLIGTSEPQLATCARTEKDLVFLNGALSELGRIPCDAVREINLTDDSRVETQVIQSQRVTATRVATLGVFALAAPKKKRAVSQSLHSRYDLAIIWDRGRLQERTVFRFSNFAAANEAADFLKIHVI
jgi:hypothetical protein